MVHCCCYAYHLRLPGWYAVIVGDDDTASAVLSCTSPWTDACCLHSPGQAPTDRLEGAAACDQEKEALAVPLDGDWEALTCVPLVRRLQARCWSLSRAKSRHWLTAAAIGCFCSSAMLPPQRMQTLVSCLLQICLASADPSPYPCLQEMTQELADSCCMPQAAVNVSGCRSSGIMQSLSATRCMPMTCRGWPRRWTSTR